MKLEILSARTLINRLSTELATRAREIMVTKRKSAGILRHLPLSDSTFIDYSSAASQCVIF